MMTYIFILVYKRRVAVEGMSVWYLSLGMSSLFYYFLYWILFQNFILGTSSVHLCGSLVLCRKQGFSPSRWQNRMDITISFHYKGYGH